MTCFLRFDKALPRLNGNKSSKLVFVKSVKSPASRICLRIWQLARVVSFTVRVCNRRMIVWAFLLSTVMWLASFTSSQPRFLWKDKPASTRHDKSRVPQGFWQTHTFFVHLHEDCVFVTKQERWGEQMEEGIERCVFTLAAVCVCVREALWSEVFEEERLFSIY